MFMALLILQLRRAVRAGRAAAGRGTGRRPPGRPRGHAGTDPRAAGPSALDQGSLRDAQAEAETGLLLVDEPHFAVLRLLTWRSSCTSSGENWEARQNSRRGGETAGVAEGLTTPRRVPHRPRAAALRAGSAAGCRRPALVWPRLDGSACCGQRMEVCGRARARRLGEGRGARSLRASSSRWPDRSARRGHSGGHCAPPLAISGEERLALLEEAVAVLEPSRRGWNWPTRGRPRRGAEQVGRRREGRAGQRRAIELARRVWRRGAGRASAAELQAGPGRPRGRS